MLYKRSDKKEWYVGVPSPRGGWKYRSTGTERKPLAKRIEEALAQCHPKEGHGLEELLDAVIAGRVALIDLGRDPRVPTLKALQRQLKAQDLSDHIPDWHRVTTDGSSKDTADHYENAVRSFLRDYTQLTRENLQTWMDGLGGSTNTRRKYAAGMSSFCGYLVRRSVIETNFMRDVALPPVGPPREHYLETEEAELLVQQHHQPYKALCALMAGSGIEVSVALALTAKNVNIKTKEVFAPGTKTYTRKRTVRVAEWAWPYFAEALEGKKDDDRIFEGIPSRWDARKEHELAIEFLLEAGYRVFKGYTMRDHRHTYAVRAVKAGTPVGVVAKQLGHVNGVLVLKVYGRHTPDTGDRDRWERIAAAMDEARKAEKEEATTVSGPVQPTRKRRKKTPKVQ